MGRPAGRREVVVTAAVAVLLWLATAALHLVAFAGREASCAIWWSSRSGFGTGDGEGEGLAPLTVKKDDRHPPYPRLRMAARVLTVLTLVLNALHAVLILVVTHEVPLTLMLVGFDVALVVYCRFYFPWIEGVAETSRQARHGWLLMDDLVRFVVKLAMWDLLLLSPVIIPLALRVYQYGWGSLVSW